MTKKILLSALLLTAFSTHAQMSTNEKNNVENKMEGTFPEAKEVTSKDEYKIHMGLTAGVNSPNGDADSSAEYGVNVGFQPYIPFGVGIEAMTAELDESNVQRTSVLARGTYNFGGDIPVLRNSYAGVTTGPMFIDGDEVEWSAGPLAGFDIPLTGGKTSDYLSLGLQAKYLYTTDTQDSFSAGLALKYWY